MASELTKRVAVAVVAIPAAIVVIYLGGWVLAFAAAALAAAGALEYYDLARQRATLALSGIGAATAAFMVLAAATEGFPGALFSMVTVFAVLVVSGVSIWTRGVDGKPLTAASVTLMGALLTGATLAFGWSLRALPQRFDPDATAVAGSAALLFPLIVTWVNDSAAYFGGRAFGKHKLIPKVSPGKTVEGSIFGAIGGVLAAVAMSLLVLDGRHGLTIGVVPAALAGFALSIAAQVGDLAESLLKREAGVKDSGTLLPGHGGVLDRLDALYFTLPLAYGFFLLMLDRSPR